MTFKINEECLLRKFTKSNIRNDITEFVLKSSIDALIDMMLFFLYYGKQRRIMIIIGGVILAIGLIGMITTRSIVIQDTANNNLTSKGYPLTLVRYYCILI